MGLTRFPHGIHATPNLGGTGRLLEMWENDNIFFVDAQNGSTSNDGKHPTSSKALPSQAVSAASQGASIYIKPYLHDQSASSSDLWYSDNIVIPYAKSGISIIGCGQIHPFNYSGVGLRTATADGTLLTVYSNAFTVENCYLTLSGGTADQGASGTPQCIIYAVRDTGGANQSRNYGGVVRGNRIAFDKSHSSNSPPLWGGSITLGCARQWLIEDNFFNDCLGALQLWSVVGSQTDTLIRNNQFGGVPGNRGVEITMGINSNDCNSIVIRDNCFADGLPDHTGTYKRFIYMPTAYTAGTGIVANNYFSTKTNIQSIGSDTDGSQMYVSDTMFMAHNYGEAITTTSGELSDDA